MSDRDKDIEMALRHQLLLLQSQVGKPAYTSADRAILAGLLQHLPTDSAPADNPRQEPRDLRRCERRAVNT